MKVRSKSETEFHQHKTNLDIIFININRIGKINKHNWPLQDEDDENVLELKIEKLEKEKPVFPQTKMSSKKNLRTQKTINQESSTTDSRKNIDEPDKKKELDSPSRKIRFLDNLKYGNKLSLVNFNNDSNLDNSKNSKDTDLSNKKSSGNDDSYQKKYTKTRKNLNSNLNVLNNLVFDDIDFNGRKQIQKVTTPHTQSRNMNKNFKFGEASSNCPKPSKNLKFRAFLNQILNFKYELDIMFFSEQLNESKKQFLNSILGIIINIIGELKNELMVILKANSLNFSYKTETFMRRKSDMKFKTSLLKIGGTAENDKLNVDTSILSLFESLELMITTLTKTCFKELYRETKNAIFKEYYKICSEIKSRISNLNFNCASEDINNPNLLLKKTVLDKKATYHCKFNYITQLMIFYYSEICFKLDYYQIAINELINKINLYFSDYLKVSDNTLESYRTLKFQEAYIMLKADFMSQFHKSDLLDSMEPMDFSSIQDDVFMSKFLTFGRFFFSKIYSIVSNEFEIDSNKKSKPKEEKKDTPIVYSCYKYNLYRFKSELNNKKILTTLFKTYFNSKMSQWKYYLVNAENLEKCRMCEDMYQLNQLVMHLPFCREHRNNLKMLLSINSNINIIISTLQQLKKKLDESKINNNILTNHILSPKSEFQTRFKLKMLEGYQLQQKESLILTPS